MMDELRAFMTWHGTMVQPFGKSCDTVRATLEAAAKAGDEKSRAQLVPPPLPPHLEYLWEWWLDLHAARPEGMHGLAALTYRDLDAWARLTGAAPSGWEVAALLLMDRTFREHSTPSA